MKDNNTYPSLLQTEEWKDRRAEILERDDHSCLGCGRRSSLQVHHRQYHKLNGEFVKPWEYKGRYLITLCERCHKVGHSLFGSIPVFEL